MCHNPCAPTFTFAFWCNCNPDFITIISKWCTLLLRRFLKQLYKLCNFCFKRWIFFNKTFSLSLKYYNCFLHYKSFKKSSALRAIFFWELPLQLELYYLLCLIILSLFWFRFCKSTKNVAWSRHSNYFIKSPFNRSNSVSANLVLYLAAIKRS